VICAPRRTVDEVAVEGMQPWNVWPLPIIQDATPVDQNMTLIFYSLVRFQIMDLDFPNSLLLIPNRFRDAMAQLDVLVELVLVRDALEILKNLIPWGVTG
jgi:hypothetical protein